MRKSSEADGFGDVDQADLLLRQLPFILGATATGLDIIDAQYNLRYVDPAWAEKYGDYHGRKCHEYFMGSADVCPDCALPEVLRTKKMRVSEETLVREGNRPIQVTSYPFQANNGEWLVAEVNVDITARKNMENLLKEREQNLAVTLRSIGDAVIAVDADGRIMLMNPSAEKLTGWPRQGALGRPLPEVFKIINAQTRAPAYDPVRRVMQTGRVAGLANHTVLITRDGRERQIADSAAPIRDGTGIRGVVLVFRDVSDEYRVNEALRRATDVVNASPVMVFIWRNEEGWPVEYVSENCERILGVRREELYSGKVPYASLVHPDDLDRVGREVAEHSRHAVVSKFDHEPYRLVRSDGRVVWVDDSTSIRRDRHGVITHYQGIVLDVTERVHVELALRESETRLKATLHSIGDGVICADAAGMITDINSAAAHLAGWSFAEACGRSVESVFRVINETTRAPMPNPVACALRKGHPTGFSNHALLIARDGRECPIDMNAAPIRNADGDVFGVVLVFRDQTVTRDAEKAMARRLALESFVADFTARCLAAAPDDIDATINDMLCGIGDLTGVDMVDVFLMDADAATVSNTHTWNAPGIPSLQARLQGLPCVDIPWWMGELRRHKTIEIVKLEDMPAEAVAEKKILQDLPVTSVLFVPIFRGNDLRGFFGLTTVRTERAWTPEDKRILETLANILALTFERRQTEQSLRESMEWYQALFQGISDAVMIFDGGKFVDCNDATLKIFGCGSRDEFLGKHPGVFSPPCQPDGSDSLVAADARIALTLKQGVNHFEWLHRRLSGEEFHADVLLSCVSIQGRNVVQSVVRDISGRKRMEDQLRANDEQLRKMLANVPGIIYRCVNNSEWSMLLMSDMTEKITGYPAADFINNAQRSYNSIIHPDDRERVAVVIEGTVRQGSAFNIDYRILRRDGVVCWVHEFGSGELDEDGEIRQLDGAIFDVTEERLRSVELARNLDAQSIVNDLLHMSLGNISMDQLLRDAIDAIVRLPWLGLDGRVAAFLVDERGQGLHLTASRGLPDDFPQSCKLDCAALPEVILCEAGQGPDVCRDCSGDGLGDRYCTPLVANGEIIGLLILFVCRLRDGDAHTEVFLRLVADVLAAVIARKQTYDRLDNDQRLLSDMNARLQQNQAQLIQSEKMASIGQLAAGVAHEINNPMGFITSNLNTLTGYIKTFKEMAAICAADNAGDTAEKIRCVEELRQREDLDFILEDVDNLLAESVDGAQRIKEIVRSLKSFSRVDEAVVKHADINECLDTTLRVVWNELKYKCTVNREFGRLPLLHCYPGQLNQVFMNLLVNAAHAIPEKGEITIRTTSDETGITVSIADNGKGIPPEHIPKLFTPFFTTKPVGTGTGLGLAVSYGIVKKHNGHITVESTPGKGAVFTVHLPLAGVPEES